MQGPFISFEGIDGAGKSTHFERLCTQLRAAGRDVVATREPGGTPLAEKLRALVLHEPMDALSEALLVFAARRDHVQQVIRPALLQGQVVVCDRFTDSSFAYQGGGRGVDIGQLTLLEQWVQGQGQGHEAAVLQPDLTLWFDIPSAVAAERLAKARTPDKFEAQSEAFFDNVSQGYARRMALMPERFVRIAADAAPQDVWAQVWLAVQARGYAK